MTWETKTKCKYYILNMCIQIYINVFLIPVWKSLVRLFYAIFILPTICEWSLAICHHVGNRLMENCVSHSTAYLSMGHNLWIDYSVTVGQYYVHMHAQELTLYYYVISFLLQVFILCILWECTQGTVMIWIVLCLYMIVIKGANGDVILKIFSHVSSPYYAAEIYYYCWSIIMIK